MNIHWAMNNRNGAVLKHGFKCPWILVVEGRSDTLQTRVFEGALPERNLRIVTFIFSHYCVIHSWIVLVVFFFGDIIYWGALSFFHIALMFQAVFLFITCENNHEWLKETTQFICWICTLYIKHIILFVSIFGSFWWTISHSRSTFLV